MKSRYSFVALGQGGGNIGYLFEQRGYPVLYINTSQEDLDTLENAKFKYHIPEGDGSHKSRPRAKQLVIDDFDNIASEIESKVKADLTFVIFSAAGGSGSGGGPILADLLIDEGKDVGVVTILPAADESVKAHINAYECFSELTEIAGTSACFVIDNQKGDKFELNEAFVDAFTAFLEIPQKHKSVKGNIDQSEIMETLKAHGMALVTSSPATESADVIREIRQGVSAPLETDRVVKYITASLAGNVQMTDLETAIGTPIDNFQTFNDRGAICCLSGLTYPQTRLETIYNRISDHKDLIKKNLAATRETGLKKGVDFLQELDPPRKKAEGKKPQSKRDIMNKYL